MDGDETQAFSDEHRGDHPVFKRTASEEPNTTPDTKRIKTLHDGRPNLGSGPGATLQRIPFPDKVCQSL